MGKETNRNFYIYYLRRPDKTDPLDEDLDQPFYIGKGQNCRYLNHRAEALSLLHRPGRKTIKIMLIHKLWKQGVDFTEEIFINNLTQAEAFELEIDAIRIYGRIDKGTGCLANMTDGGDGGTGLIISEEQRKIRSERFSGKGNPMFGKPVSDETREKLRQTSLGRKQTDETKQKKRDANKDQIPWSKGRNLPDYHIQSLKEAHKRRQDAAKWEPGHIPWNKGKKCPKTAESLRGHIMTDETKMKISQSKKGRPLSEEHKEKISLGNRKRNQIKRGLLEDI